MRSKSLSYRITHSDHQRSDRADTIPVLKLCNPIVPWSTINNGQVLLPDTPWEGPGQLVQAFGIWIWIPLETPSVINLFF